MLHSFLNSNCRPAPLGRLLAIALLLGAPIAAQSPGSSPMSPPRPPVLDPSMGFNDNSIAERQAKMLNVERQKVIVSDTARILELARQLNADAASDYTTLSAAERVHKAEEIEKLAKTVREKMIFAIGVPPPVNPYSPWQQR